TPRTYWGTPSQLSDTGVSRTTTSSGTMKIRESVSALGKFTQELRVQNPGNRDRSLDFVVGSVKTDSHCLPTLKLLARISGSAPRKILRCGGSLSVSRPMAIDRITGGGRAP